MDRVILPSDARYSVERDSSTGKFQLTNDASSPGNNQVYSTNGSGTRGWQALSTYLSALSTQYRVLVSDGDGTLSESAVSVEAGAISGVTTLGASGTATLGGLSVGANTDITGIIGRAKIGYNSADSDYANFAHYDQMGAASYALAQTAGGITLVNAASGQYIALRINDGTIGTFNSSGLAMNTLEITGATKIEASDTIKVDNASTYVEIDANNLTYSRDGNSYISVKGGESSALALRIGSGYTTIVTINSSGLAMNSKAISGATTITGSGNIETTAGVYKVNGTQVVTSQQTGANQAAVAAQTSAALTDNSGGAAADGTIDAIDTTITDPGDAPADADALRDDLVANTIPDIEGALGNCADAIAELADQMNKVITDISNVKTFQDKNRTDQITHGLIKGSE